MASMATAARVMYPHIVKQSGYCGGKATIDSTRVRVADVVCLYKEGATPSAIPAEYPGLTLAQVHAALTYYYDHAEEIEGTFSRDETAEEEYERARSEYLSPQQYGDANQGMSDVDFGFDLT